MELVVTILPLDVVPSVLSESFPILKKRERSCGWAFLHSPPLEKAPPRSRRVLPTSRVQPPKMRSLGAYGAFRALADFFLFLGQ